MSSSYTPEGIEVVSERAENRYKAFADITTDLSKANCNVVCYTGYVNSWWECMR